MGDGEMSGNGKSVSMLGKSDRIVEGNTSQIGRLEPIFQPPLGSCNRFRDRGMFPSPKFCVKLWGESWGGSKMIQVTKPLSRPEKMIVELDALSLKEKF